MSKTLSIFRAGRHTALSGQSIAFSEADLAATVAAYNPALHEAPLVVGHPKVDAPAYGWVKGLSFSEGQLTAEPHQVDAAFQEIVNSGKFKKISASFYLPDAPQNPVPGVYYLKHVGFLGAAAPAVKGLKNASFAANEEGVVSFGDLGDELTADAFRSLREWIISEFGLEAANRALPSYEVSALEEVAHEPEPASEPEGAEYAEAKRLRAKVAAQAAEIRMKDAEVKNQAIAAFCEAQSRKGKIAPGHVRGVAAFMANLDDTTSIEFGEGGEKTPMQWFKGFIDSLPKQVEFSEIKNAHYATAPTADFAVAPGGGDGHEIRTVGVGQAAGAHVQGASSNAKKDEEKNSLTLPGDPRLVASALVNLTGWGRNDGIWLIKESEHILEMASGYTTKITLRRQYGA
jgi:hypothetical protein